MNFKKVFAMILAGLMALTVSLSFAGCGSSSGGSSSGGEKKPVKVSLAMLRLTSSAPLFIAMDKGYFKEEGIESIPSGSMQLSPLRWPPLLPR